MQRPNRVVLILKVHGTKEHQKYLMGLLQLFYFTSRIHLTGCFQLPDPALPKFFHFPKFQLQVFFLLVHVGLLIILLDGGTIRNSISEFSYAKYISHTDLLEFFVNLVWHCLCSQREETSLTFRNCSLLQDNVLSHQKKINKTQDVKQIFQNATQNFHFNFTYSYLETEY